MIRWRAACGEARTRSPARGTGGTMRRVVAVLLLGLLLGSAAPAAAESWVLWHELRRAGPDEVAPETFWIIETVAERQADCELRLRATWRAVGDEWAARAGGDRLHRIPPGLVALT